MAGVARLRWWQWIPFPWRRWRILARVEAADEVPERLPHKGAVLVALPDAPTWIAFECPCQRGHRVMLNLHTSRSPRWSIIAERPLTISPSIDDAAAGRRCHFFLTGGRIEWVESRTVR
jgi:Family of unknown function (DUF6527)